MGSEMCIRDRVGAAGAAAQDDMTVGIAARHDRGRGAVEIDAEKCCLLYTSDAADERSSVDLGGRRIIKKKKNV